MKICFPVDQLEGLESAISPSFRSSPALLVVDSETRGQFGVVAANGSCGALPAQIDAIVCAGGIGRGMFNNLKLRGIRVFNSDARTVADALAELAGGRLVEIGEVACCGGHADAAASDDTAAGCGCSGERGEHEHEHAHGACACAQH